jgi:DNA-binding beta-propeller fold protein YncE
VRGIAFINEGTFGGADDGTLDIYVGQQRTTVDVGDTPNHLLIHDGRAYVTVNGSHHIIVVDLAERKVIDTIKTGTSGYDGPRESAIDTKDPDGRMRLYVTTFTGDVRIFDLATGQRTGTLAVGAKPEGLAIIGRELWVTRTFVEGGYAAARDVVIFDLNALTSVRENIERKAPSAYLAVGGSLRLPFELQNDATLTDLAGKTTRVSAVVSDAQTLDCRHLTSGVYALRSGQHSVTVIR